MGGRGVQVCELREGEREGGGGREETYHSQPHE